VRFAPQSRQVLLALAALAALAGRLAAQNVLFTEYDGKFLPVVRARGTQPFVEVAGKQVAAYGHRFALQKTEEYLRFFVAVRNVEVKTTYLDASGSEMNHDFHFRAWLETPYWLDDVFVVLELDTERAGKVLFLHEVGRLEAREPKQLSLLVPMTTAMGTGRYQFHLFAGGAEVLHSNIDPMYREEVVDRMTAKRIASVKDADPKPYFGPGPEYPAAFRKTKTKGAAVISLRIGANGRVYDPAVKSATDPAFGETALVAVRMWRFFPRVKNGRPVESSVDFPFDFTPPEKPAKKS
jgi:TonB family protein